MRRVSIGLGAFLCVLCFYHASLAQSRADFESVVALRVYDDHKPNQYQECSGVILKRGYLITSAHCFRFGKRKLRLANGERKSDFHNARVLSLNIHPAYDLGKHVNDLAILKFRSSDIGVSNYPAISLAKEVDSQGEYLSIGYGMIPGTKKNLQNKNKKYLPMLYHKQRKQFLYLMPQYSMKENICSGDSGGAVFVKKDTQWMLSAIIMGNSSARSTPSCIAASNGNINELLSFHISWIEAVLRE